VSRAAESIFRSSRSRRDRRREDGRRLGQRFAVTVLEVMFVALVILVLLAAVDIAVA
jgi:hypothetical protein